MPSVATWWCGQDAPRASTCSSISTQLVIKPAFPRFGQHAEFPATMTPQARATRWPRASARSPTRFVAQEQVDLSDGAGLHGIADSSRATSCCGCLPRGDGDVATR